MTIIANLSSVFKLKPIRPSNPCKAFGRNMVSVFAGLCNQYAPRGSLCSNSIFSLTNYLWVAGKLLANQQLIDHYRLGKCNTEQFLNSLLKIFSFLKNNKKVKDPLQLLAETWNQIIEWDEESTENLQQLLDFATVGQPVYFITNSNPLNLSRVFDLFKQHFPKVKWNFEEALKEGIDARPIEIAPNFYICSSHRYGMFKEGTPGLVRELAKRLPGQDLTLVSQFPGDLAVAENSQLKMKTMPVEKFYHTKLRQRGPAELKRA